MAQATFLFKLRSNIDLDGDLALARRELESLVPKVQPVRDLGELPDRYPILSSLGGGAALTAYLRSGDIKAYLAHAPAAHLPQLIRRLSFIQTIYAIVRGEPPNVMTAGVGNVVSAHRDDDCALLVAIPHYTLMELADIVARRSAVADIEDNLDSLRMYLLGSELLGSAHRLAEAALSAKVSSGLLTHDLHYYKAKFFPRLARAMLNICRSRTGLESPRVLDPFAGSGTTLLEATLLGIPSSGLDIDPLSVLITEQKLAALHFDTGEVALEAAHVRSVIATGQGGDALVLPPRLVFPQWLIRKFGCGQKYSFAELETILDDIRIAQAAIQKCDLMFRPVFSILLSDAISRKIKFRFLGTGVGRFSLNVTKRPLLAVFEANIRNLDRKLRAWAWLRTSLGVQLSSASAFKGDARTMREVVEGEYHIVLTSPPYLPAASGRESYARSRAPSLLALGLASPAEVDSLESHAVGAMEGDLVVDALMPGAQDLVLWLHGDPMRAIKAAPTSRYFLDMRCAFKEMFAGLALGGYAAVVTGKRSVFYRFSTREVLYVAESAELLAKEAHLAGFEIVESVDLALRKANMNARPRSLDDYYETVILLHKPLN